MKRVFFISALFHGVVLLLLFSWEIPLTDRLLPKDILEVSLVEKIEKKLEGKKRQKAKPAPFNPMSMEKMVENKDGGATRQMIPAKEAEKKEEPPQEKNEVKQTEMKEEKTEPEEKVPSEDRIIAARSEEAKIIQPGIASQVADGGGAKEMGAATKSPGSSGGRGDSGATFLASAGFESGKEGIALGRGGKGSGAGKGEGKSVRSSSIQASAGGMDPVHSEILRRIERAKLYPRMARKMGIEGQATIRFRLKPDGKVESVELVGSSGSDILDQASLETVHRAAPLPYKEGWLKVVIIFKIL